MAQGPQPQPLIWLHAPHPERGKKRLVSGSPPKSVLGPLRGLVAGVCGSWSHGCVGRALGSAGSWGQDMARNLQEPAARRQRTTGFLCVDKVPIGESGPWGTFLHALTRCGGFGFTSFSGSIGCGSAFCSPDGLGLQTDR